MSKRRLLILAAVAAISFGVGIVVGDARGIPFIYSEYVWSVGIYRGETPLEMKPIADNPVFTAEMVTGMEAIFVADPFLWHRDGKWALFVEVLNAATDQGEIVVATSDDGEHFTYAGVALDEPWHLSYPLVFEHEGEVYMAPESTQDSALHLYRATDYPLKWERVATLLEGRSFIDSNLFFHNGKWWIFTTTTERSNIMRLYMSDALRGPFVEHPQSPVVLENPRLARGGGHVLSYQGRLYRYAQDASGTYGTHVHAVEITKLTPTEFDEQELKIDPIVEPSGVGWNSLAMHHAAVIPHPQGGYIAAVDGLSRPRRFSLQH